MRFRVDSDTPRYRICSRCGKPMAHGVSGDVCPVCQDAIIYPQVREYIEKNDVTEVEVAEHFNIPLYQVKEWIKDGRLTYKNYKRSN